MQFFWFFYTNTEGTSYGRKRTGGVYPYGHASQGAKPPQTKNLKNILMHNYFFFSLKVSNLSL